jgi:hypothetical protein
MNDDAIFLLLGVHDGGFNGLLLMSKYSVTICCCNTPCENEELNELIVN